MTRKSLYSLLNQHKWFFIPFLLLISIAFYLELTIPKAELFLIINHYHSGTLDTFFKSITYIGDGITMIVFALFLSAFNYRYGLATLLAYAYTSIFAQSFKFLFHAPRPVKYFEELHQPIRTISGYTIHQWYSFPSGHSVSAFSLAVIVAWLLPATKKKFAWTLVPIAVLTAFSRVYLAQHFIQDIVAGAILGVVLTFQLIYMLENSNWFYSERLDGGYLKAYKKQ